jgi:hypothetical protein
MEVDGKMILKARCAQCKRILKKSKAILVAGLGGL